MKNKKVEKILFSDFRPESDTFIQAFVQAYELRDYPRAFQYWLWALFLVPQGKWPASFWNRLIPLVFDGFILPVEHILLQLQPLCPAESQIFTFLGFCAQQRGDPQRARHWLGKALQLQLGLFFNHQIYLWSYLVDPSLEEKARLQPFLEFGKVLEYSSGPALKLQVRPDSERRLRLGYISSDFYPHSVNSMYASLFERANRKAFEVYIYASLERQKHPLSDWFKAQADCYRSLAGLSTRQAAEQIRADGIDILIDLNGITYGHRLDIFALKPAPIQVSGLGFGWSSGLSRMDYLLTDPWVWPPERAALCPEKPLYLSSIFHWLPDLEIQSLPDQRLESPDYLCFAAFHQSFKLNLDWLSVWAEILRQVPDARLLIKGRGFEQASHKAYYRLLFKQWGIAPERLLFAGRTSAWEHLSYYQYVDLVLDSFPYQAGITACEAFYMGVPVISCSGGTRAAHSLLHQIGHPELLARNPAEYVDRAVALIQDRLRLLEYRQHLRQDLLASPITDMAGFIYEVESHYRNIWRQWCENGA